MTNEHLQLALATKAAIAMKEACEDTGKKLDLETDQIVKTFRFVLETYEEERV